MDCDTAYWEVIVGKGSENVKIGIKKFTRKSKEESLAALLGGDLEEDSSESYPAWTLKGVAYKESDVIGVYWDQTDQPMLSFSLNGVMCSSSTAVNRVRPAHDIFPAVSVKSGSTCSIVFDGNHFAHPPASKFRMIICATSII